MEQVFKSRTLRAVIAAGLVAFGLWGFAPYVFKDVASSAYVNAELMRVSTPVAGVLSTRLPASGSYLRQEQRLHLVTARTPDRSRLDDLERQAATADATAAMMGDQLAELARSDGAMRRRGQLFNAATLQNLAGRAHVAEAEAAACRAREQEADDRLARTRQLAEKGFATGASLRSAANAVQSARESCKAALADIEIVRVAGAAARQGVYLNDGASDASYEDQEHQRLMLRRQELMTELMRAQSAQAQLSAQVRDERIRYARAAGFEAVLPADHLVWSVQASPGSQVGEGQTLLDLADCRNRFVVVAMPARKIEGLHVGDVAQIRLLGSGAWSTGHVRRILGGAAKEGARLLAAEAPSPGARGFTVEVALDTVGASDARRSCDIGRPAEVRFDNPMLGRAVASLDRRDRF